MPGKPVIGLIGGIGSGKSQVAASMARQGAYLISGDSLGHEALRQPDIVGKVVEHFGAGVLDAEGSISRRRLGALVFADEAERRALERRVFPYIERRMEEEIAHARQDPAVTAIVVDAAILLESGWNKHCDCVVYVHAPRALRLQRLAAQRGWGEKEAQARERAQMSLTEKVTRSQHAIDNSGPLEDVDRQVRSLLSALTEGTWPSEACPGEACPGEPPGLPRR